MHMGESLLIRQRCIWGNQCLLGRDAYGESVLIRQRCIWGNHCLLGRDAYGGIITH